MIDFIEHVRDPEAELRLAGERLAPTADGCSSRRRAPTRPWPGLTGRHWPQYREEHLTYFSLAGLAAALQRAGLVVVTVVRHPQGGDAARTSTGRRSPTRCLS